jgi:hypothetical protein
MVQLKNDGANDVIESWAETATRYQSATQFAGIKIDLLSGTGQLKVWRFFAFVQVVFQLFAVNINEYTLIIGDKFRPGCPGGMCQRGRNTGFSEAHDKGVDFFAGHQLSPSKI